MKKKVNVGNVLVLTALIATTGYLLIDKKYCEHDRILRLLSESSMTYISEPQGRDYWQTIKETEKLRSGDCEDMALYLYTKLKEKGYHPQLKVGAVDQTATNLHMWVEIEFDDRQYILDPTANAIFEERNPVMYIDLPNHMFRIKLLEWELRNEKENDSGREDRISPEQDRD